MLNRKFKLGKDLNQVYYPENIKSIEAEGEKNVHQWHMNNLFDDKRSNTELSNSIKEKSI